MAVVTVAFEDLDSWLQAQPANTVDTPYELEITGLTASDISRSSISGTLGYILKQNSTKYVDLSRTTIPSDNILWESFFACTSLVIAPKISTGVRELDDTFRSCINLVTVPMLPNGVTEMSNTFEDCRHLVNISAIPDGVTKMFKTFKGCTALIIAPAISNSVTEMIETFYDCTSLIELPDISHWNTINVKDMRRLFYNFSSLN